MFGFFEKLLPTTTDGPDVAPPPGLGSFYWHYARQTGWLLVGLFAAGTAVALLDLLIPIFIGYVVTLVSTHTPREVLTEHWHVLALMAFVQIGVRPLTYLSQNLITNQAIVANLTNLVRWQSHWHVVRQGWSFFQSDFAGRIANRVMQTGPSLRESIIQGTNAVWYILVYGASSIVVLSRTDGRLVIPLVGWFCAYLVMLRFFVPRLRDRSKALSEARSNLTGRVVDSYTNILTVKLFARASDEDAFVRASVDEHTQTYRRQLRMLTFFGLSLSTINACMVVGMGAMAITLWVKGSVGVGVVAMALPLGWQISAMSGWVAMNITGIFENVGTVLDGMKSIATPATMRDPEGATPLHFTAGEVAFKDVSFGYVMSRGVLHHINLTIKPGERIGLVGPSGAGKSTMVNLLLRFFDLESGAILIDGQDIAALTQESLRGHIAVVTQDTSLLHRSIRENIRYGRPEATDAEVEDAAARAHATEFINQLEDWQDRRGFDAHVGERGVKLSGGQRQRIALARVILKNAPILVLDEATSALDSEVEAAIQEQLGTLMEGRTVIAIAHRLSTIARMDRLVVMDKGEIVETGSHTELLAHGGIYARLWERQSGGFQETASI